MRKKKDHYRDVRNLRISIQIYSSHDKLNHDIVEALRAPAVISHKFYLWSPIWKSTSFSRYNCNFKRNLQSINRKKNHLKEMTTTTCIHGLKLDEQEVTFLSNSWLIAFASFTIGIRSARSSLNNIVSTKSRMQKWRT